MHYRLRTHKPAKRIFELHGYERMKTQYSIDTIGKPIPPVDHHFWIECMPIPITKKHPHIIVLWADVPHFALLDVQLGQYALLVDGTHYRYLWPAYDYEELTHYMPLQLALMYDEV